jgi:uncharacterized membrane protein YraQ (UPF0718 family)
MTIGGVRLEPAGWVYLLLVVTAYIYTWRRSRPRLSAAARASGRSLGGVAGTFLAVFGLVGLFQVYVSADVIERFMGRAGGMLSLLVGAGVGAVAAGPPAAAFPIARTLLDGGAWNAAILAFIASWVLVGVVSLPFEAKVFGARYAIVRNAGSFLLALVIGLVGSWLL